MSEKINPSVTPETVGTPPQWPGDKLKVPGVYDKSTKKIGKDGVVLEEKTTLPEMPNHSVPTDPA
jgi:hypothetical protein